MPPKNPATRIKAALTAHRAAHTTLDQIAAARQAREAAEELESSAIRAARDSGVTWATIGALYGLSKQGAQQRFRAADRAVVPEPTSPPRKKHHRQR